MVHNKAMEILKSIVEAEYLDSMIVEDINIVFSDIWNQLPINP